MCDAVTPEPVPPSPNVHAQLRTDPSGSEDADPSTAADKDAAVPGETDTWRPALAIEGVSHSYGARRALKDARLSVAPASFTALPAAAAAW